jgi:hypothetical protein
VKTNVPFVPRTRKTSEAIDQRGVLVPIRSLERTRIRPARYPWFDAGAGLTCVVGSPDLDPAATGPSEGRRDGVLILAFSAAFAGDLPPSAAQVREERHRELGLVLAVPQDFERIPVPPAAPWIVLQYVEGGDQLLILRFDRTQAQSQSARGADFADYLARGEKAQLWKVPEGKEGKPREGWTTREYSLPRPEPLKSLNAAWAYELRSPQCTWGLLGFFEGRKALEHIASWRECAEQMKFFEPETATSSEKKRWEAYYRSKPQLRNPEYRMTVRARLPEGWDVADTENFIFLDDSGADILMRHLQRKLEGIRKVYAELFPPTEEITAVATVRVCKDRDEYLRQGGDKSTSGYWNPLKEELVLYEAGREDTLRRLYHEAFHQYVHHAIGELQPHLWFNEGYGDYFCGARFTDEGEITQIQVNSLRLPAIQAAIRESNQPSWKDMLRMERGDYYGPRAAINYAMGWSMIYFLEESGVVAKHPAWSQILSIYFDALKESAVRDKAFLPVTLGFLSEEADEAASVARERALDAAFMGVDLSELEAAWREFVLKLKAPQ